VTVGSTFGSGDQTDRTVCDGIARGPVIRAMWTSSEAGQPGIPLSLADPICTAAA